jgi:hypothetical protein
VDLRSGRRIWKEDVGGAPIGAVAAGPDAVYVAGLAPDGKVVALTHDPAGRLIAEVSPTVLFPLRALLSFVAAALLVGALILLLFRIVLRGKPWEPAGTVDT